MTIRNIHALFGRPPARESIASANTTTLIVDGLNMIMGRVYEIEIAIKSVAAATSKMQMYINGNTNVSSYATATIYFTSSIQVVRYTGSDICNSCSSGAAFVATGDLGFSQPGNFRAGLHSTYNNPSTSITGLIDQHVSVLGPIVSTITSIQITADVANAIAAGSYIRVRDKD